MLCGADVTMMLRSHGGLVSVADVTKTKIYKSLMFSSNCIVCILLDKMCIGDVSTINIYMHTHVHHTCQYSIIQNIESYVYWTVHHLDS